MLGHSGYPSSTSTLNVTLTLSFALLLFNYHLLITEKSPCPIFLITPCMSNFYVVEASLGKLNIVVEVLHTNMVTLILNTVKQVKYVDVEGIETLIQLVLSYRIIREIKNNLYLSSQRTPDWNTSPSLLKLMHSLSTYSYLKATVCLSPARFCPGCHAFRQTCLI